MATQKTKVFTIGYNKKMPYENEKGKKVLVEEYIIIVEEMISPFNKEETLKKFIIKNKDILKQKKIKPSSLIIETYKDISFNEMIDTFKGNGIN